jgi:hypothetical protein
MSDSDGSHSCRNMTQDLTQDESGDPRKRCLRVAVGDMSGRRSIRA